MFAFHNCFVFISNFDKNKTSSSLALSSSNLNVMFSVFSKKITVGGLFLKLHIFVYSKNGENNHFKIVLITISIQYYLFKKI